MSRKLARFAVVVALCAGGCAKIIGFPDYSAPGSGGAGGVGTTTTSTTHSTTGTGTTGTTTTGTTGSGGQACAGEGIPCYDGLDDTAGVGSCKEGTISCEGGAPFCDDVRPAVQACTGVPTDTNCDGMTTCSGAFRWSVDALPMTAAAVTAGVDGAVAVAGTSTAMAGSVLVDAFDARGRSCWSTPSIVGMGGTLTPLGVAFSGSRITPDGRLAQVNCNGSTGLAASTVVVGYAAGAVDFGQGLQMYAGGTSDAFIAALDPTGKVAWGQLFGSMGTDAVGGVATDLSGNIYVTGYFEGPVTWTACPLVPTVTTSGDPNTFVARLDPAGNCNWVQVWTGNLAGTGIAVGADGILNVVGRFYDTIDVAGTMLTAGPATNNTFVVKLAPADGMPVMPPVAIDVYNGQDPKVAVGPGGGVFVAGTFTGTYTANGVSCGATTQQAYLQVLDPTLHQETPRCYSSATAASVGSFGVVDDGAGGVTIGLSSSAPIVGYTNPIDAGGLVVLKLQSPAYDAPLWTRSYGTTGTVTGAGIAVDGMGFLAIVANPNAPIDLGGATTAAAGAFVVELAP